MEFATPPAPIAVCSEMGMSLKSQSDGLSITFKCGPGFQTGSYFMGVGAIGYNGEVRVANSIYLYYTFMEVTKDRFLYLFER